MNKVLLSFLLVYTLSLVSVNSYALDYSFRGFGTLQASINTDDSTFADINDQGTLEVGSHIAGQLNVTLSDNFSLTYQGKLAPDKLYNDDIKYSTDLAFITYQPSDFFKTRIGRLRTPFFLNSEFIDTNLLLPWKMAPISVYGQIPILKHYGIDAIVFYSLTENIDFDIQLSYGNGVETFEYAKPFGTEYEQVSYTSNGVGTVTFGLYLGEFTFRLNHSEGKLDTDDLPVWAVAGAFPDNSKVSFDSVGFKYEDEEYFLLAEYASRRIKKSYLVEPIDGYYLTAGYKFPNFMPSLTYGRSITPDSLSKDYGIVSNLSFVTSTLKWDISQSVDIKFEYTHYTNHGIGDSNYNVYISPDSSGRRPKNFDIVTLSVNFIF